LHFDIVPYLEEKGIWEFFHFWDFCFLLFVVTVSRVSESYCLYDFALMANIFARWVNRSMIAVAHVAEGKMDCHCESGLFEVIIVDFSSYRLFMSWKNKSAC
jgi:hypothetical protein